MSLYDEADTDKKHLKNVVNHKENGEKYKKKPSTTRSVTKLPLADVEDEKTTHHETDPTPMKKPMYVKK